MLEFAQPFAYIYRPVGRRRTSLHLTKAVGEKTVGIHSLGYFHGFWCDHFSSGTLPARVAFLGASRIFGTNGITLQGKLRPLRHVRQDYFTCLQRTAPVTVVGAQMKTFTKTKKQNKKRVAQ